jgi:hypothetical protein
VNFREVSKPSQVAQKRKWASNFVEATTPQTVAFWPMCFAASSGLRVAALLGKAHSARAAAEARKQLLTHRRPRRSSEHRLDGRELPRWWN